jgi:2-polyprenyl-3-methyl-5-hydroxy-6-metoxy-1,4-benzoquinol methylase
MPSSQYYQINEIMDLVFRLNPRKVLDIGPGFGKYGFLCREYLELWDGRNAYGDWKCRIDCIEAFEKYLTPVHHAIYTNVYTGNALDVLPRLNEHYDLILMVDVLEHFSYVDGRRLMRSCMEKSDHVLIATPKAVNTQEEVFENKFEQHRFEWKRRHFKEFGDLFFAPHHSTLICLAGKRAPSIGKAYRKNQLKLYFKRHFRFLRILKRLFN